MENFNKIKVIKKILIIITQIRIKCLKFLTKLTFKHIEALYTTLKNTNLMEMNYFGIIKKL